MLVFDTMDVIIQSAKEKCNLQKLIRTYFAGTEKKDAVSVFSPVRIPFDLPVPGLFYPLIVQE